MPFVLSGEALPDHQGLVGVRPLVIDDEHPHPGPDIPLPAGVSAGAGAVGVLQLFASPLGVLEPGGLEEDGQELAFREHLGEVAQARPPPRQLVPRPAIQGRIARPLGALHVRRGLIAEGQIAEPIGDVPVGERAGAWSTRRGIPGLGRLSARRLSRPRPGGRGATQPPRRTAITIQCRYRRRMAGTPLLGSQDP